MDSITSDPAALLTATIAAISMLFALWVAVGNRYPAQRLTPLLMFVAAAVLFINTGFFLTFLASSHTRYDYVALANVSLGLACTATGAMTARFLLPVPGRLTNATPTIVDLRYRNLLFCTLLIFAIVIAPFVYSRRFPLLQGVAAFFMSGPQANLLSTLRNENNPYLNPDLTRLPLQGLFDEVRYTGLPIVAVWFFSFWQARFRPVLSASIVAACAVLLMLTGQRWPLMYMVLSLMAFHSFAPRRRHAFSNRVRVFLACGAAAVCALFLSVLLARYGDSSSFTDSAQLGTRDLWSRILFGNVDVPYAAYAAFPEQLDYLDGWSYVQNLWAYVPGHPLPSFPVTFHQLITGNRSNFTAPPDFFTEAFINFGFAGTVMLSFAFGMLLVFLERRFLRSRNLFGRSFCSVLTVIAGFASIGGISWLVGIGIVYAIFRIILRLFRAIAFLPPAAHLQTSRTDWAHASPWVTSL